MKSVNPFNGKVTEYSDDLKEFIEFIHTKAAVRKDHLDKQFSIFEAELDKAIMLLPEDSRMNLLMNKDKFNSFCDNFKLKFMDKFQEEDNKLFEGFIKEFLDQTADNYNDNEISKDRYMELMKCWSKFIKES